MDGLDRRAHGARRVLERVAAAGPQRRLAQPARRRVELARGDRRRRRAREIRSPRPTSRSSVEPRRRRTAARPRRRAGRRRCRPRATVVRAPDGQHDDLVADAQRAAGELAGVAAVVVAAAARADDPLHRQPQRVVGSRSAATSTASRCSSSGGPSYQGAASERSTTLSPCSARDRDHRGVGHLEAAPPARGSRPRSRGSAPRPSRRGPSCSRTRRGAGCRAARTRNVWRRDCSTMPLRASISTSARSAVEAPVTMLRV